jgi:predicted phage terminase large subunit-like protein
MDAIAIRPQPGPQESFLSTSADIAFYGGAAGGGKTFALLLEPLRHISTVKDFGAVVFRRTTPQITNEGGLWDEAVKLYRPLGAIPRESLLDWRFPPYNNTVKFAHMEREDDRFNWQGAQIPLICFDQLEHFTRKQVFYMFSRSRTTCGIRPYIRGNYNPVPADDPIGGWIHEFVGWYIDDEGYPIPERSGMIRWFVNLDDKLHWFDSEEAAVTAYPAVPPKSFTYILSTVYDNKILLEADPGYLANLFALDPIDRERLLRANHKIKPAAGKVFNRGWFEIIDTIPAGFMWIVRYWDLAASEKKIASDDPDFTAGVKMGRLDNLYIVLDCVDERLGPADIDRRMSNTAGQDGKHVRVRWEEEGGASGKRDSYQITTKLSGYDAAGVRPQGDKVTRSKPLSAQAAVGNVKLLRGDWNERWLSQMHGFPDLSHDDIPDASSGAFNELVELDPTGGIHV